MRTSAPIVVRRISFITSVALALALLVTPGAALADPLAAVFLGPQEESCQSVGVHEASCEGPTGLAAARAGFHDFGVFAEFTGSGFGAFDQAIAHAGFTDTITIVSDEFFGPGFFHLTYDIVGTISSTGGFESPPSFSMTFNEDVGSNFVLSELGDHETFADFSMPFTFGQEFTYLITAQANAVQNTTVDFFNSATFALLTVFALDTDLNEFFILEAFTINGLTPQAYVESLESPLSDPGVVPEPATLLLLGAGGLAALGTTWRRHRRRSEPAATAGAFRPR